MKPHHIFLFALGCILSFGAGALVAVKRGWGSANVQIDVVNRSGKELRALEIKYTTCGDKQNLIVSGSLSQNQRKSFVFLPCGEGGYQVQVEFADGSKMLGNGGYVENGYRITEFVEQKGIRSEVEISRL